jgi:fibronectin type 3 domain-containing protein
VYRRARAGGGAYGDPLNGTPTTGTILIDTSARRGESWCYVVRSVVGTTPVIVESVSSDEVCMAVQDVFPPAAPTGVAALPREGAVEVSWSPAGEGDVARYRVYRASGGGAPARIGDVPAGETAFTDKAPGPGSHAYTVTAVDRDGNESPPSRPAEARLP